ncbi:probable thiopurine S-methyltransferase isoform X2 [Corticium candelabrum]|uniref:probable thiopurine S-methyltransferase isoform X2 n=1 Tax=Corticium candelabrum TaxID=121492 RepID=UPI002E261043|nr:probable thiopurine S-methyltransferase isoform X2 [Corticium candelabrum]
MADDPHAAGAHADAIPRGKIRNHFGVIENKHMQAEDWERRWELGQDKSWQMPVVHPLLQKHIKELTQGHNNRRILVPLCGRSLDVNWLVECGHRVVGVELVEDGVLQLFGQHRWEYEVEEVRGLQGGKRYRRPDGKVEVWNTSFFNLTKDMIGVFDGIWDRGALAASNPKDREKYFRVILNLLDDAGSYMLDSFGYTSEKFHGPPFVFSTEDIEKTLGATFTYKKLEDFPNKKMLKKVLSWGITDIQEFLHILKKRKT